jgi:hypothetical protein
MNNYLVSHAFLMLDLKQSKLPPAEIFGSAVKRSELNRIGIYRSSVFEPTFIYYLSREKSIRHITTTSYT